MVSANLCPLSRQFAGVTSRYASADSGVISHQDVRSVGALKGLSQLALSKQQIGHDEVRQVRTRARPDGAVLGGLFFKLCDMLCVLCALQGRAA